MNNHTDGCIGFIKFKHNSTRHSERGRLSFLQNQRKILSLLLRTKTVLVHVGAIPDWHSSNPNCSHGSEYDFSEMFIVHNTYLDRADKAVRTHGDVSFSQGGSFYDVIYGRNLRSGARRGNASGVMYATR